MFKSFISYLLGFFAGLFFIVALSNENVISGIICICITFALAMCTAIKIHKHMKSKYENRFKGAYKNEGY